MCYRKVEQRSIGKNTVHLPKRPIWCCAFRIDMSGCITLTQRKIEVNKIPNDRMQLFSRRLKNLEKRKTTA
jgi:hypothetical protein